MTTRSCVLAVCTALSLAFASPAVSAQSADPHELEPPEQAMPDEATVRQLIDAAAASGAAEGARSIGSLVLRGLPPGAAAHALDALAALSMPEGAPAVSRMLTHRRPALRLRAVAAAAAVRTPELLHALAAVLGDSDESVRVAAAAALAERGGPSAVGPLRAAMERDLEEVQGAQGGRLAHECARAIGRLGGESDVLSLLPLLRRVPLRTMADALRAAVARPDLPEALRLRIVRSLGDLATRDARDALRAILGDARGADTEVTRAARAAVARIPGDAP